MLNKSYTQKQKVSNSALFLFNHNL